MWNRLLHRVPGWLAPTSVGMPTIRIGFAPLGRAVQSGAVERADVIMELGSSSQPGAPGDHDSTKPHSFRLRSRRRARAVTSYACRCALASWSRLKYWPEVFERLGSAINRTVLRTPSSSVLCTSKRPTTILVGMSVAG